MDRVTFLLRRANFKRQLADGRIDRETFNRRLVELMIEAAGVSGEASFDAHVEKALELVR